MGLHVCMFFFSHPVDFGIQVIYHKTLLTCSFSGMDREQVHGVATQISNVVIIDFRGPMEIMHRYGIQQTLLDGNHEAS